MSRTAMGRMSLTDNAARALVTEQSGTRLLKAHLASASARIGRPGARSWRLCNARLHVVLAADSEGV